MAWSQRGREAIRADMPLRQAQISSADPARVADSARTAATAAAGQGNAALPDCRERHAPRRWRRPIPRVQSGCRRSRKYCGKSGGGTLVARGTLLRRAVLQAAHHHMADRLTAGRERLGSPATSDLPSRKKSPANRLPHGLCADRVYVAFRPDRPTPVPGGPRRFRLDAECITTIDPVNLNGILPNDRSSDGKVLTWLTA